MRFTFGSAAALAAALLLTTAFWPESPQAPAPRNAVAQGTGSAAGPGPKKLAATSVATEEDGKEAVDAKLAKRIGKVEFIHKPLAEVLTKLSEQIDVDILINRSAIEELGIQVDSDPLVELVVKRANLSARMALELVLEPLKLSYTIRDGLIMVTTSAEAAQIQVYNVRDLLRALPMNPGALPAAIGGMGGMGGGMGGGMMGVGGGGFFCLASAESRTSGNPFMRLSDGQRTTRETDLRVRSEAFGLGVGDAIDAPDAEEVQLAQGFGGGGGGIVGRESHSLANVIATTIDPNSWDTDGGNGSIVQYHELLVVKNSQTVHRKIKALLEMMRVSAREIPDENAEAAPAGGGSARGPAGAAPELSSPGK